MVNQKVHRSFIMRPTSLLILSIGALAVVAVPHPSEVQIIHAVPAEQTVLIQTAPTRVTETGLGLPISVAEVLESARGLVDPAELEAPVAEARMDDGKKISKRFFGKDESPPPPPPSHGWGGWGQPPHPPQGQAGLVGPFAFQLGAYYNPYLPTPLQTYGPSYSSPQTRQNSYQAPAAAPYSPPSSYSSPPTQTISYQPATTSPYSAPSSPGYSAPSSSSYSSPSPSYPAPSSYDSSSSPSYGSSPSYSSPSSYGSPPSYGSGSPTYGSSLY